MLGDRSTIIAALSYIPPLTWSGLSFLLLLFALMAKVKTRPLHLLLFLASIVFLGGFCYPIKSPEVSTPDFKVLTLNTYGGRVDGRKLADLIQSEQIDFVLVQETREGDRRYGHELLEFLPNWSLVEEGESAILSKQRFVDTQTVPVFVGRMRRFLIKAQIGGPRPLTLISVHWPIPLFGRDPDGLISRIKDAEVTREIYAEETKKLFASDTNPVILGGDFNTPPLHFQYRDMASELKNTFAEIGKGFGYTFKAGAPAYTRIDHIWHSEGVTPLSIRTVRVEGTDHMGIIASYDYIDRPASPSATSRN